MRPYWVCLCNCYLSRKISPIQTSKGNNNIFYLIDNDADWISEYKIKERKYTHTHTAEKKNWNHENVEICRSLLLFFLLLLILLLMQWKWLHIKFSICKWITIFFFSFQTFFFASRMQKHILRGFFFWPTQMYLVTDLSLVWIIELRVSAFQIIELL